MVDRSLETLIPRGTAGPSESFSSHWMDELSGPNRDAAAALIDLFTQYGLGTLAPKIIEYLQEGFSGDTIALLLQDTAEFKTRFAANEARRRAGLSVLSPADYLRVEAGYRQALQASGVPGGYYDSVTDFQRYLELDVSPDEIKARANEAIKLAHTIDPGQRQALQRFGIDVGDLAAYYLNVGVAVPILQRKIDTALLGYERERAGFTLDEARAETLAQMGVSLAQAREGYSAIAEVLPTLSKLGAIEGDPFTVGDLESEVFDQSATAATRRKELASRERARFSGSAGQGRGTLTRERGFDT
jgi:hypothetical protein